MQAKKSFIKLFLVYTITNLSPDKPVYQKKFYKTFLSLFKAYLKLN